MNSLSGRHLPDFLHRVHQVQLKGLAITIEHGRNCNIDLSDIRHGLGRGPDTVAVTGVRATD
jgi:hypothetical protein